MNKQIDIFAFHKLLNSDSEGNDLLTALQKLTQMHDTDTLDDIRAYGPMKGWGGGGYSWGGG